MNFNDNVLFGITYQLYIMRREINEKQDVIKAYGEPTSQDKSDTSGLTFLESELGDYSLARFAINGETNTLDFFTYKNEVAPENLDVGEVSTVVPFVVTDYKAPTSLGDDFSEGIVEFEGALYDLPAPFSEFKKMAGQLLKNS